MNGAGSMRRFGAALLAGVASLAGTVTHAQALPGVSAPVQTAIVVSEESPTAIRAGFDAADGTLFIDGGTLVGENLFHSFVQFDLAKGDTAAWLSSGSGSIANIINRVTGGAPSHISGTIDTSSLPGADFWFINPDGVLFGEGARINVPGAAHFSTGSEIRFADGATFSARTPEGSSLTMANPVAFGFLGGEADLVMTGLGQQVFDGGDLPEPDRASGHLSLVAPDVTITETGLHLASIDVLAAGTAGEVPVAGNPAQTLDGTITLSKVDLLLRGDADGRQSRFGGGIVDLSEASIRSLNAGSGPGTDIVVGAVNSISLTDASIFSRAEAEGTGGAILLGSDGSIRLERATINSGSLMEAGGGKSGTISIAASGAVDLFDSQIASFTEGSGDAGGIFLRSFAALTDHGGVIFSGSILPTASGGDGGNIDIYAAGPLTMFGTQISGDTYGGGKGGYISMLSGTAVNVVDGFIASNTANPGDGGPAGDLSIGAPTGQTSLTSTVIASLSDGNGDSGSIFVSGRELALDGVIGSAQARSDEGSGNAGSLSFFGQDSITIRDSRLFADAYGTGTGGDVFINSLGSLDATGSDFSAGTRNSGAGGEGGFVALISVTRLDIADSSVSTDTFGDGAGGYARVFSNGPVSVQRSTITADSVGGTGEGGFVEVESGQSLAIENSEIFADTYGAGDGGYVLVRSAGNLSLTGGYVSSESLAQAGGPDGDGGSVTVEADGNLAISGARVSSDTFGAGEGGVVLLNAGGTIDLSDGAEVFANTNGAGEGGLVAITASELSVNDARVATRANAQGDAFAVTVQAARIRVGSGGVVSSASTGAGDAGFVFLGGNLVEDTPSEAITVSHGGEVTVSATGTGAAGSIRLNGETISLLSGGEVAATSANALPAGFINIAARDVIVDGQGSRILSANSLATPAPGGTNLGGDILLIAKNLTVSNGGVLNTSSESADAGTIEINLGREGGGILYLGGDQAPGRIRTDSVVQGSGGRIGIFGAYAIIADGSEISASGDVSNAFVFIDDATVRINSSDARNIVNVSGYVAVSPEQDVSSGTTMPEVPFLDASQLLASRCQAARARGRSNSLDIGNIGPYSLAPEGDGGTPVAATLQTIAGRACL